MTAIGERQRAPLYIYKKEKIAKRFYIEKARHLKKSKTISVPYLYTKSKTLHVTRFVMTFLKLAFIYKKHDNLHYVTFLCTNSQTLRKKQDNLRFVFMYKNADTLLYVVFHWIFWNWLMGRYIFIFEKQYTLRYIFMCKNNALSAM